MTTAEAQAIVDKLGLGDAVERSAAQLLPFTDEQRATLMRLVAPSIAAERSAEDSAA